MLGIAKKRRPSFAQKTRKFSSRPFAAAAVALGIAAIVSAEPLWASLGGDVTSVRQDQSYMQASLQSTSKDFYTVHEMRAPNNIVVREYAATSGKIFAVAWEGPGRPDLHQLLGSYFDTFNQAVQTQKAHHVLRGPLVIEQSGLVVQLSGHPPAFTGRAYLSQMIPTGVHLEEIQ